VSVGKEDVAGEGKQAVLRQVDRQGHVLILEDGRMLRVAPSDATLAVTWMPATILEICEDRETSLSFPLVVFNTVNDDGIHATWSLPT
jgi:hypothetical protein